MVYTPDHLPSWSLPPTAVSDHPRRLVMSDQMCLYQCCYTSQCCLFLFHFRLPSKPELLLRSDNWTFDFVLLYTESVSSGRGLHIASLSDHSFSFDHRFCTYVAETKIIPYTISHQSAATSTTACGLFPDFVFSTSVPVRNCHVFHAMLPQNGWQVTLSAFLFLKQLVVLIL